MSTDTVLSNLSVVDNLSSSDTAAPLSANQGKVLESATNTLKMKLDKLVSISAANTFFLWVQGDLTFSLRWDAAFDQVAFRYEHAGVDPGATLTFNYRSSKAGVFTVGELTTSILTSGNNRYFNPGDILLENTALNLATDGDSTDIYVSIAVGDGSFNAVMYLSSFRYSQFEPAATSRIYNTGWRIVNPTV